MKHSPINPLSLTSWAERWDACKGTRWETECLEGFVEHGTGELAEHASFALIPECYDEAVSYMEDLFRQWDCDEAFKDAAYGYEVRTGRPVPDAFDLAAYTATLDRGFGGAVTQFNRMEGM